MIQKRRDEAADTYDAIVVGARVAGAATALQLARAGHRVLVVDRRRPGTDTLSTHALMRAGVLQLQRWGVLDRVIAADTPAVRQTVIHYGESSDRIVMKPKFGVDALYAPRRFVLDTILVEAAAEAGAEVRFGISVDQVVKDAEGRVCGIVGRAPDGERMEARARIVVGADGARSAVAREVGAEKLWAGSHRTGVVYAYFSGEMCEGYEWFYGETAAAGLLPTNQGQTCVWVGVPGERFMSEVRGDLDSAFWKVLDEVAPEAGAGVRAATRESRFHGFPGAPGFWRRAWGPGWALVGDASHFKDPLSAHGITDALRDAEFLAQAICSSLGGWSEEAEAFAAYERIRDRLSGDMIRLADRVASFDWSLDEVRGLLLELSAAMNEEVDDLLSLEVMQRATAA
jgi:2-polyprenyl-6-methoxyphenol hydroxylase-like FAD-dependent oxidoreductase